MLKHDNNMVQSVVNNRKIAKNTVFLYLRMLIVMGVSLYTVRVFLNILGVVDYGIYNVVGSVVAMFSFVSGTLASSSQRYFSVELARNDIPRLTKWFSLNITTFLVFIGIIILIAETIGLWFLNNKMTIPGDRMIAANVVYQFSIVSCALSIIIVPYNALIIARERMSAFAFIGLFEAAYKLLMVLVLSHIKVDSLILYAFLFLLLHVCQASIYVVFCRKRFPESKYKVYWNRKEFLELMSFSGWHFLGTISSVVRSQGINILINMFFNPAVNAARAVAFQVNHAVGQFSNSFTLAVKPQLYKTYSIRDFKGLYALIFRSTILAMFLSSLVIIPLMTNSNYILGIWLKEVPQYAVLFTQLVLFNGLLESTNTSAIVPALATGNIKRFEITIAALAISNLPLSYIALSCGLGAYITMVISILLSLTTIIWRAFLLRDLIELPYKKYLWLICKLIVCSIAICGTMYFITNNQTGTFIGLCTNTLITVVLICFVYYSLILDRDERQSVKSVIKGFFRRFSSD